MINPPCVMNGLWRKRVSPCSLSLVIIQNSTKSLFYYVLVVPLRYHILMLEACYIHRSPKLEIGLFAFQNRGRLKPLFNEQRKRPIQSLGPTTNLMSLRNQEHQNCQIKHALHLRAAKITCVALLL